VFVTDYQPVLDRVPTAMTVHDLRYVVAGRGESSARALAFRAAFPGLARRARWIVVPTAAVGDQCVRRAGVAPEKIVVVPNAPDAVWRRAAPIAGPGRHLLVVGIAEPRKQFARLVEAFRRARRRGAALPLVAVGRGSASAATVLRGARDLVDAGALRWVGTPADAELVAWMRDAAALLHPSVYEGFGLPVLEAFACGVPVVAQPVAAVEEVGGGLVRWVEGDDVEGWAEAIVAACSARWDRLAGSDARRARAAEFTWDAAAASFLRAVERRHG
jgi:alpha-1,3-rhamnosyl/mannosyltransferase